MNTLGIDSIVEVILNNVSFLEQHVPDLVINNRTFGRILISDVTDIVIG
jgi:hypothetical protein